MVVLQLKLFYLRLPLIPSSQVYLHLPPHPRLHVLFFLQLTYFPYFKLPMYLWIWDYPAGPTPLKEIDSFPGSHQLRTAPQLGVGT